ncbi:MAG: PilT/PilU family type 4a pilus ATPase [Verrucomicrobiota bacterium]
MRSDLGWFFSLCQEGGLLTAEQAHQLITEIDFASTLEEVADRTAAHGWISRPEDVRNQVKEAGKRSKKGDTAPELTPPPQVDLAGNAPDFASWQSMDDTSLKSAMGDWVEFCQIHGVSDLHLTAGARPRVRHYREIVYLSDHDLDPGLAERMNLILLTDEQQKAFAEDWDLDYSIPLETEGPETSHRLRVNLTRHHSGVSGVYHMARPTIGTLEELGFPNAETIRKLLAYHNGIILVTGPVGSGKTTTLASLLNELNETRSSHIITIEDPIEVVQSSKECILTQRQVGVHTRSFDRALGSALREDPDIIVVGEMRDLETIEMALTAAETGHLVIGTLHTRDAASTLSRLLDVFPSRQQSQIRAMTADSLRGIICQRLLPSTDGKVALACELMINNSATANIMRDAKESGLEAAIQTGRKQGMRAMDESIAELYEVGRISLETAQYYIKDQNLLSRNS